MRELVTSRRAPTCVGRAGAAVSHFFEKKDRFGEPQASNSSGQTVSNMVIKMALFHQSFLILSSLEFSTLFLKAY